MDIILGMMIGVITDTDTIILITGDIIIILHIGMVVEVIILQEILKKETLLKGLAHSEVHQGRELQEVQLERAAHLKNPHVW